MSMSPFPPFGANWSLKVEGGDKLDRSRPIHIAQLRTEFKIKLFPSSQYLLFVPTLFFRPLEKFLAFQLRTHIFSAEMGGENTVS